MAQGERAVLVADADGRRRALGLVEVRVMMLMTPLTALAPYSVPPGPLTTSMRSMSSIGGVRMSQKTPECRVE